MRQIAFDRAESSWSSYGHSECSDYTVAADGVAPASFGVESAQGEHVSRRFGLPLCLKDHNLVKTIKYENIIVEKRPLRDYKGNAIEGLYNHWIILNNPKQFNSYTTDMVKEVILAFRQASCDRSARSRRTAKRPCHDGPQAGRAYRADRSA